MVDHLAVVGGPCVFNCHCTMSTDLLKKRSKVTLKSWTQRVFRNTDS